MSSSTSLPMLLPDPGGQPCRVFWRGDTVLRPAGPWTGTVHGLLRHLERAGFAGAPRIVGDGYDDQGHEVLTSIEGTFVHPQAWSDEQIWHAGRLLRALHDTAAGFRPPRDAFWYPWPFRAGLGEPGTVISHCDAGPWHFAVRDGVPFALIDWDTAGPTGRLDEIAATAWWNAQLHDDDIAERNALPPAGGAGGATGPLPRRLPAARRRTGRADHHDDRVRDPRQRGRSGQGTGHPRLHRSSAAVGAGLAGPVSGLDDPPPGAAGKRHRRLMALPTRLPTIDAIILAVITIEPYEPSIRSSAPFFLLLLTLSRP